MHSDIRQPSKFETYAKVIVGFGAAASVPAIYGLLSSLYYAFAEGNVMVFSVGRYETSHSVVPWPQAWARFLGFTMLVGCGITWLLSARSRRMWWLAFTLSVLGFPLILFSQWFTTLRGTAMFLGIAGFVALAYVVDWKVGRVAATLLILFAVSMLVWRYVALNS